jgi:hypothetical protein
MIVREPQSMHVEKPEIQNNGKEELGKGNNKTKGKQQTERRKCQ